MKLTLVFLVLCVVAYVGCLDDGVVQSDDTQSSNTDVAGQNEGENKLGEGGEKISGKREKRAKKEKKEKKEKKAKKSKKAKKAKKEKKNKGESQPDGDVEAAAIHQAIDAMIRIRRGANPIESAHARSQASQIMKQAMEAARRFRREADEKSTAEESENNHHGKHHKDGDDSKKEHEAGQHGKKPEAAVVASKGIFSWLF